MKKNYIKMNGNNNYLSLGNLFDYIKYFSKDKNTAMQSELFCSIFQIENINYTTINNYCTGFRTISTDYKRIYEQLKDSYIDDNNKCFINIIMSIVSIMENKFLSVDDNSLLLINNNHRIHKLCIKCLELACNDKNVNEALINKLSELLDCNNYYDFMCNILIYAVLENKQPIYKQDIDIKINTKELNEYLKIKLYEGVSYITSLEYLAMRNNMYACAELGSLEYDGYVDGNINYDKSYEYYLKAAKKKHPKACMMVAYLIYNKLVKKDFETMWKYLNISIELGSSAGLNLLGKCYLNGITPNKKIDKNKAKLYFRLSSDKGYVYAFNNLGLMCENEIDALEYFKLSADLGESWALNKLGEHYRLNKEYDKAFYYYNKSISCPIKERNSWGYYNLATYFYKNGLKEIGLCKNKDKYYYYMEKFREVNNKTKK